MSTIGVAVFSLGGARSLGPCLKSVDWADAVVVLHLGGGDRSVPEDVPHRDQIEWVFSFEEAGQRFREMKIDWIFHLWEEERLDERLQQEILSFREEKKGAPAREYRVRVRSRVLHRWVKGSLWGPSPALRLSARLRDLGCGFWDGDRLDPDRLSPLIPGWVEDYSAEQLEHGLERMNRFSDLCAERLAEKGIGPRPLSTVLHALGVGARLLAVNGVLRNGLAGVTFSILAGYTFLLGGTKLWEKGMKA